MIVFSWSPRFASCTARRASASQLGNMSASSVKKLLMAAREHLSLQGWLKLKLEVAE